MAAAPPAPPGLGTGAQEQLLQMCFGSGDRELNLAMVRARRGAYGRGGDRRRLLQQRARARAYLLAPARRADTLQTSLFPTPGALRLSNANGAVQQVEARVQDLRRTLDAVAADLAAGVRDDDGAD